MIAQGNTKRGCAISVLHMTWQCTLWRLTEKYGDKRQKYGRIKQSRVKMWSLGVLLGVYDENWESRQGIRRSGTDIGRAG